MTLSIYQKENIQEMIKHLHTYQKTNNIRNKCVINTIILYDFMRHTLEINVDEIDICLGWVFYNEKDENDNKISLTHHCHIWLEVEERWDPSYDMIEISNKIYIKNYNQFNEFYVKYDIKFDKKELYSGMLKSYKNLYPRIEEIKNHKTTPDDSYFDNIMDFIENIKIK